MALPLIVIGLLMIVVGARGTYGQFATQVSSDFTGAGNFTYWFVAIVAVGALGYIPTLQTISRLLIALIILSIFLSHKGFFQQFQAALKAGPKQPNAVGNTAPSASALGVSPGTQVPVGSGGGGFSSVLTGQQSIWNWLQGSQTTITAPAQ